MNPPVDYLNEDDILAVRDTPAPRNASRTGYGAKIGTSWELQLRDKKWRRVYVMQWSNSGSAYVLVGKKTMFLGSFDPRDFKEPWYQARRERNRASEEWKRSGSPARASRRASPAPRPDALGHLLHKGASKIVRLVTGKK